MLGIAEAAALLAEPLNKLNEGQPKLNSDKYPILKTTAQTAEEWWDSLNYGRKFRMSGRYYYCNKIDVGGVAMHLHLMSANCKWDASCDKFSKLSKSQQRIIKVVFNEKDNNYSMFDMKGLLGLR